MTTLEKFKALRESLNNLSSQLAEQLLWMVVENRPRSTDGGALMETEPMDLYLVGQFEDEVTKIQSMVETARDLADKMILYPFDPAQAAHSLAECGQALNQGLELFLTDPGSYERLVELFEIEQQTDNLWSDWAKNVRLELGRSLKAFLPAQNILCHYWLNLAADLSRQPFSIQNTSIGQQISLPMDKSPMAQDAT